MLNAIEDDEEEEIPVRQSPIKTKKVESVKRQTSKLEKNQSAPKLDETMKTP